MLMVLLIALFAFIMNLFLPWWSIVIPGLAFGYQFNKKGMNSFGAGFLAVFLLWGGQALYIHFANDGIISNRIADMLSVGSPYLVILITAIIGGLVSGVATLSGTLLKSSFSENPN